MESTQKIWVRSRRASLKDRAEVLRIQYFERNPPAFFQGSVQKTVLDRAGTINFSLPKPGFTQKSEQSLFQPS
jgi:hypothetical protein